MPQQRKFFPGWLVVASGFVIMATCYTIFVNCMSLFQPLIVSDLGISLAQYNVSNAISTVVSVIGSLVIGHVADKVSGRVLGSLTVIATSAVLAGMSFVGELWQVYVLFAVSGSFASAWIVCLVCSVVMLVFLLASEPIAAKLRASVAGEQASVALFCSSRSVRGRLGSRMDARTIIRFPRRPRAYEMIPIPPSPTDHVIRRGRRKADRKQRRCVRPNVSPYPRSVRRAAAVCVCAV